MKEKRVVFTGSATAMVTPFTGDGLNLKTLDQLVDYQLAGGTDALVVCGTTGEPSTMDISEEAVVISRTVERVGGRVPVIAGAGSNDTAFAVQSVKQAKNLGADALLLVTPYYNKTSQQGLIRHFLTIADATDLPILLYNVPSRTGLNLLPATLKELAKHENIVGVKEASGNIEQMQQILDNRPEGFLVLSGDDGMTLELMRRGGDGVISVAANAFPRRFMECINLAKRGAFDEADRAYERLHEAVEALFAEGNPVGVKCALSTMGLIGPTMRLPLVEGTEALRRRFEKLIAEYDLR